MKMKIFKIFLFFFIFSLSVFSHYGAQPKIKKNKFAKKNISRKNFPSYSVTKEFFFRKEIILDNDKNINLFPKGYSELTNTLIKSVTAKEIDAFTNEDIKKKISVDELKKNLTIPINIENFYPSKNEKYFSGEEIKKIEIYGKYIKKVDLPQPTIENISVTLIIPAGTADITIERNVFSLKYSDFIILLKKKNIYIEKEGIKKLCSEAFENINDNFIYNFINVNDNFLKKTSYKENNKIAEKLFKL